MEKRNSLSQCFFVCLFGLFVFFIFLIFVFQKTSESCSSRLESKAGMIHVQTRTIQVLQPMSGIGGGKQDQIKSAHALFSFLPAPREEYETRSYVQKICKEQERRRGRSNIPKLNQRKRIKSTHEPQDAQIGNLKIKKKKKLIKLLLLFM